MKKRKFKKSALFGIVIVLLIVIIIIVLLLLGSKRLDTEGDEVSLLYSYLGSNDLDACGGLVTYDETIVTADSLDESTKICIAYSLLSDDSTSTVKIDQSVKNNTCSVSDDITFATDNYEDDICTVTKIDASKIKEEYETVYGEYLEEYSEFLYDDTTICYYNSEDDSYYCGLLEEYTYTIGAEPHTYRSIKKAIKDGDEIIIYDYFLKVVNDTCYSSFVGSTEVDKCSSNYDSDSVTYSFLKKYGTTYKHTYKLGDNGYYWVSSEVI